MDKCSSNNEIKTLKSSIDLHEVWNSLSFSIVQVDSPSIFNVEYGVAVDA